jgi:hypothetical protein
MSNFLKKIDLFGVTFQFRVMKENKFRTTVGGILTIFYTMILIVFFFLLGRDFMFKKNPRVSSQEIIPENYTDPFVLTQDNMLIAWRLSDEYAIPINFEGIVYPFITYYHYSNEIDDMNGSYLHYSKNIEFTKCSSLKNLSKEFSEYYNTDEWYCIDWGNKNLTFGGGWDATFTDYFNLKLSLCPSGGNFSPGKNCTDIETIEPLLKSDNPAYFDILFPEYYLNIDDLNNPLRLRYKNYFYKLSVNIQKNDRMFFKNVTLDDDVGWIFEESHISSLISFSERQNDFDYLSEHDYGNPDFSSTFYVMNFYMDKDSLLVKRSFMKIQELGAIMGGFTKFIILICNFLSIFKVKIMNQFLWSQFFDYKDESSSNFSEKIKKESSRLEVIKNNSKLRSNSIKTIHFKNNFVNNSPGTKPLDKGENLFEIYGYSSNKSRISIPNPDNFSESSIKDNKFGIRFDTPGKDTLNFGKFFSFKRKFCQKHLNSHRVKLYDLLNEYFNEKTDICYYLKSLFIFDRMRSVLFNQNQNFILEIPKKSNLHNQIELANLENEVNKNYEKHFNLVTNYFSDKIKNCTLDHVDEKLCELVGPKIKKYWEEDNLENNIN